MYFILVPVPVNVPVVQSLKERVTAVGQSYVYEALLRNFGVLLRLLHYGRQLLVVTDEYEALNRRPSSILSLKERGVCDIRIFCC